VSTLYNSAVKYERNVLASILLNPDHAYDEAAQLRVSDFSLDSHRRICARMKGLAGSSRPINITKLTDELERHKELEEVGGCGFIASLIDGLPDRPSIKDDVTMVREAAGKRHIAREAHLLEQHAMNGASTGDLAARFSALSEQIISDYAPAQIACYTRPR